MKKIAVMIGLICLLFSLTSVVFAAGYPNHLKGDSNFVLCDGHMGTGWYINRSSLNVQSYDPPQYIISVDVVAVEDADRGNTVISSIKNYRFFYNYNLRQMYVDRKGNSSWEYLNPQGSWAETGVVMPAGELAFAMAYHLRFYGSLAGYDDAFYDRL